MGKNLTGGNKQKSKKNHIVKSKSVPINQIMPDNENRFVAKVTKMLGSCRVGVTAYPTSNEYNALIPGSFKNRIWINNNDFVLIEISTELAGANCYVIHKYDVSEIKELIDIGMLTIKTEDIMDETYQFSNIDTMDIGTI